MTDHVVEDGSNADAAPSSSVPLGERHPLWLRELSGSLPAQAQLAVTGNIRDLHLLPEVDGTFRRTETLDAIWEVLAASDYELMLVFDPVSYLRVYVPTSGTEDATKHFRDLAMELLGLREWPRDVTLSQLATHVTRLVTSTERRAAIVIDYASRLTQEPERLSDEVRAFMVAMEKLSHVATPLFRRGFRRVPLYNAVVWLLDSDRDLPGWFIAGNDGIRSIPVPVPGLGDRGRMAALLAPSLPGAEEGENVPQAAQVFAQQTQGMTLRSMVEIQRLAIDRRIDLGDVEDAVRCYRVGLLENPWKHPDLRPNIATATEVLGRRVKGQAHAIRKSVDILIRSATGLTGAHASAHAARPRGIVFFAGPTGVGKTELAKAITQVVFGHEAAYIRFDMSEFSSEHSEARLIGSPPGYIGHDAGGELTKAISDQPFSLVLFDEIEKAHPRILDKFLQILEDGRLTDGTGITVHFSESLLVFTSNLGIYVDEPDGVRADGSTRTRRVPNVAEDTPRAELESRVVAAIKDHFTLQLNRPELLNRLGDNIVVFDFITAEVAAEIAEMYLANVAERVHRELGVDLSITEAAREALLDRSTADRSFGGRGIGSALETILVNPLARALFETDAGARPVTIEGIIQDDDGWRVVLS